tara:strand:- start:542 stop:658 length:117 start_codon:yes stop_codon:yes gene_type:complete
MTRTGDRKVEVVMTLVFSYGEDNADGEGSQEPNESLSD